MLNALPCSDNPPNEGVSITLRLIRLG